VDSIRSCALVLAIVLLASGCAKRGGSDSAELKALQEEVAALKAQATTVAPTTTITVIGPLWQVSTEVDPMTDEITYTAELRSTGPEHFFGNGPSLYVTCSHVPSSPTLFLVANMPSGLPFDANFDSATGWTTDVLLRFDKEDAQQLVAPVDVAPLWSNYIYFSDDVSRLWADRRWVVKMLGANQLLISGEAHGSDPVDKYDLRGMEQRAAAVLKPCGWKIGSD
jgi:hypothetical protein